MDAPVMLCGSQFGLVAPDVDGVMLQLRRHRLFDSNVWTWQKPCRHDPTMPTASVYGHGGGWTPEFRGNGKGGYVPDRKVCAALLGIDWPTTAREVSESIPPAYTEWLGRQLLAELRRPTPC